MVSENQKGVFGSLQLMPPFFQGQLNGQQLTVADVIIYLRRVELPGEEGAWVEATGITLLLR